MQDIRCKQAIIAALLLHFGTFATFIPLRRPPSALLVRGEMGVELLETMSAARTPNVPGPIQVGQTPTTPSAVKSSPVMVMNSPAADLQPTATPPDETESAAAEPRPEVETPPDVPTEMITRPTPVIQAPPAPLAITLVDLKGAASQQVEKAIVDVQKELTRLRDVAVQVAKSIPPAFVQPETAVGKQSIGSKPSDGSVGSRAVAAGFHSDSKLQGTSKPRYPFAARANGWQGEVVLALDISAAGRVLNVSVLASSGYSLLDEAAVEFARSAQFEPALDSGIAVASRATLPIRYRLR